MNLTEDFINIEVCAHGKPGAHILLQSVARDGRSLALSSSSDLKKPLLHAFLIARQEGGGNKDWALLVANQGYGLPLANLKALEEREVVSVTHLGGESYF